MCDYPSEEEEFEIVRQPVTRSPAPLETVLSHDDLLRLQDLAGRIPVADHVLRYATALTRLTRREMPGVPDFVNDYVAWGAGPRASQHLVQAAKSRALLQGREYVSLEDVRAVAPPVIRHRLVTNFNAEADNVTTDDIVRRLIEIIPTDPLESCATRPVAGRLRSAEVGRLRVSDGSPSNDRPARRSDLSGTSVRPLPGGVTPALLARLSGLELRARTIVEGMLAGRHRSPHHGFSVEFAEHREYARGDDLRYVDWKLYGKSDRYFLKQFEEETNFTCHVLLDVSESMRYRSAGAALSKLEYAAAIAAALAYVILRQQDAVGLMTFDTRIQHVLRASGTPTHFDALLRMMEECEPSRVATVDATTTRSDSIESESDDESVAFIEPPLREAASRLKSRGVVLLMSDLFASPESLARGLKLLRHGRHDVIVGQVIDPAEQDFPFEESTRFVGLEGTGARRVEPRSLCRAYREEFEKFLRSTRSMTRDLGMDYHLLRTDRPLDVVLSRLISRRVDTG